MTKRTVEIAGAGLSGLALSIRLAQLGWRVRLHERNSDLRMFGAGIWLWENGLKSLAILGAYEDTTRRAKVMREWRICDGIGRRLMTRPMSGSDRMLVPPRADLYQALIDRAVAHGVDIVTSSVVVSARPEGVLVLENGTEIKADLVVGADGAYSRIRESILATRWMDHGVEAGIRMMIDHAPGDPEDHATEYWNGAYRILHNPCTSGETYIFLGAPISDKRSRVLPVDRALWTEKFPAAADLIARFTEAGRWDRVVNVRCRHWSEGHVALIGDGAHAMPPNLGQAANMAFINAMALAMAVTGATDIPQALADWERQARPLTEHVQWWSYIYGYIVAEWPAALAPLRSDLVRGMAQTEWFEEGLNRGSRAVPVGYAELPEAERTAYERAGAIAYARPGELAGEAPART
jgi:2-polyprenyl-6-methoxyphenol hydroxylase-like FAD-dependent oxidoreductase